ncbi:MAG: PH domain-containing protein [Anaerolineae bacterium]
MSSQPKFPGQHLDEDVIFKERRHWFILLKWVIPPAVLFLAAAGIGLALGFILRLNNAILWAGLILLLSIGPLGLTIWRFLDWENDHYILTNQRVLHIERVYFLFESRKEANLGKIQDVSVKMPTVIANALHFGDVEIQTAGTTGQIKFEAVPRPRTIQRRIFKEAGLPVMSMQEAKEWQVSQMRIARPLEMFTQMLYPVYPRVGEVYVWRKHWFVLLTKMLRPLLAALILLVLGSIISFSELLAPVVSIPDAAIPIAIAFFLLVLIVRIAWIAIDWHNDLYILTETHVLDIEKRPFTSESRREARLGVIQDVSYTQPSFVAKLLDYGNTRLETAGKMGEFTFDSIPRPREVQNIIIERLKTAREEAQRQKDEKQRAEIQQMIDAAIGNIRQAGPGGPP